MEQSGLIPVPSIRGQLLLISLVVLILPWVGIKMIQEMEGLLRDQQVQSLIGTAKTVQSGFDKISSSIEQHDQRLVRSPVNSEILLTDIPGELLIDGYADDWPVNAIRHQYTPGNNLLEGSKNTNISVDATVGYQAGNLILLFDVTDDVLYQDTDIIKQASDLLLLGLRGPQGYRRYVIGSNAPGWLDVISVEKNHKKEARIQAELQSKKNGYTLEISIPGEIAGDYLAFAFIDRDNENPEFYSITGNADPRWKGNYGLVFDRYSDIGEFLASYLTNNRRISLVDVRSNVLAVAGLIKEPEFESDQANASILDRLYQLFLIADELVDLPAIESSRLDQTYVTSAIKGNDDYRFQKTSRGTGILSVATPVILDNRIVGALIIEESTQMIHELRQEAQVNVIWMTFLAIAIVIMVLLLYAALLIYRIQRLNNYMQAAVDSDGRINSDIPRARLNDELGDLNRGVVNMVARLQEYQRYMETMASKLSHELRTPLTVVQSSLENLHLESNQEKNSELLGRANEGLSRLRSIVKSLTEASRLERALESTDIVKFDLCDVVRSCVEGYRIAYTDTPFEFNAVSHACRLSGSPELIAQLLDKLVSNALDFREDNTPILLTISETTTGYLLSVENTGPALPEHLQDTLFDSMISQRTERDEMPHLGMGLFVVRLIAEFHNARVSAINLPGKVRFSVKFDCRTF